MSEATTTAVQDTTESAAAAAPTPESVLYDKTPSVKTPAPEVKTESNAAVKTPEVKADAKIEVAAPPAEKPKVDAAPPKEGEKPVETTGTAPVEYKLDIPKESLLSVEQVEGLKAYAKEKALTPVQAQELLVRESTAVDAFHKNQQTVLETKRVEWAKAAEQDSEIGGAKFAENVANAQRVLAKYGSDALKSELDRTGFGNHPELLRVFSRLGRDMANDKFIKAGVSTPKVEKSLEEIFYPSETIQK